MTIFKLPDLGEGLQEAEIVTWHVAQGDHVITDQPLLSVETDKAVVEVPAPFSGTVARLLAEEGAIVAVGAPLVEIGTGKAADTGTIVGRLQGTARPEQAEKPRGAPATQGKATPAVRKLAREKGVDLSTVAGSGPGGAILSADVVAAAPGLSGGEALHGVRRAMAKAMARAHASVVPATVTDRADLSAWREDEEPTPRLVRAVALACTEEPALNAWFDGDRRQLHDHVDLGIAVDTEDGLFVPVLRDVAGTADIGAGIARLRHAVETRTIAPGDMQGATITLSNFGMLGGEFAALVVSPPQVAILGAGRIRDACLPRDGQAAVRRMMPLSLTFDHRAVTGGEAARFLAAVRAALESPSQEARR